MKCAQGIQCPLYKFAMSMVNINDVNAYSLVEQEKIRHRKVDYAIVDIDDYIESVYGKHCCTMSELKEQKINRRIYELMEQSYDITLNSKIFFVCTQTWFRKVFSVLPRYIKKKEDKLTVNNWRDAKKIGALDQYFKDQNELNIEFDKSTIDVEVEYGGDYYDYVNSTFELKDRVKLYHNMLKMTIDIKPEWAKDYESPYEFNAFFEQQLFDYIEVLSKVEDKEHSVFFFVGDGPGTGAIASIILGLEYMSMEPNGIGRIAKQIGIITGFTQEDVERYERETSKNPVMCLFYVLKHVEKDMWYDNYPMIIIDGKYNGRYMATHQQDMIVKEYDDGLREEIQLRNSINVVETGCGNVFTYDVDIRELNNYKMISHSRQFFKDKLIEPVDWRSCVQAYLEKMNVSNNEGSMQVVSDGKVPLMNIFTRNDPRDKRTKNNMYKQIHGNVYKVNKGMNSVWTRDAVLIRTFNGYKDIRFSDDYYEMKGLFYVPTPRPERLEGIFKKGSREMIRLILIRKMVLSGVVYGIYRDYEHLGVDDVDKILSQRVRSND